MRVGASLTVLALCVAHASWAAEFRKHLVANPAHPGMCSDPELLLTLAVNTSVTDHKNCRRIVCRQDRPEGYLLIGSSCASPRERPDNCGVTKPNLAREFPYCCRQLKCDGQPKGSLSAAGK